MATISYDKAEARLKAIADTTTDDGFIYELLRIFAGVTETSIERTKEGKGNLSKDGETIIPRFGTPKRTLAYRVATSDTLALTLQQLKDDPKVAKHNPRLYIVSDGQTVLGYDPKDDEEYDNEIAILYKDFDFFMPLAGVEKLPTTEEDEADVKASYIMAKIYDDIKRYNQIESDEQIHALNVFLTRLLFCFFAEDTGIFEKNLFTESIRECTLDDGSDLSAYIEEAFDIMNIESPIVRERMPSKISQFPYVNGGLFAEHFAVPLLTGRTRKLILKCGNFNWAEINPDIFGSMIQAVIRPEDRAGLGLHYTSVPNIMKVIRPLFLDELYEAFAAVKDSEKRLNELLVRMSKIKLFDPACGSGNFLIIAYKELRKLENLIWLQIIELRGGAGILPFSNITLTQFYGIEIDKFAQETAVLSLWLAEHQMNKQFSDRFHISVAALPLKASGNIAHGNACRLDWAEVCPHRADEEVYIMGNPPYLGRSLRDESSQSDMDYVFDGKYDNYKDLDYISCWFEKGAEYIENCTSKLAFVTTNSICQGVQVGLLWGQILSRRISIYFAYQSFKWGNNAKFNAGVTCAIVGLESLTNSIKYIYSGEYKQRVNVISPYLTKDSSVIVMPTKKILSSLNKMDLGSAPKDDGALVLSESERNEFIANYPEHSKFVKKYIGSVEFINGYSRYCLWIPDTDKDVASANPEISKRLEICKKMRLASKKIPTQKLAETPWAFGERRNQNTDSIIVPAVSSERREYIPMGFLDENTVISNSAFAVYDAQVWLFGLLTSKMHMAWVKAVGGKLEERIRYSATICYNTFPFPKISNEQRAELESYAEEVLLTREEFTELTLAQMYDPDKMPPKLRAAHHALDLCVERCYRPAPFQSDEERLETLFRLYEKMTKK